MAKHHHLRNHLLKLVSSRATLACSARLTSTPVSMRAARTGIFHLITSSVESNPARRYSVKYVVFTATQQPCAASAKNAYLA